MTDAPSNRWTRKPQRGAASQVPELRRVYTIGTWRVSREVYLWQLSSLDIKFLVDIRGNPRAGREEQLFRGKDFTRALLSIGVRYEYWGDKLGEDQLTEDAEELRRVLKGLLAAAPKGPICLLGHMHEPQKCHRLQLCDLLPANCKVEHLMWQDHRVMKSLSHDEASELYRNWVNYFDDCLEQEKLKRQQRKSWRRGKERGEAKALPVLNWEKLSPAEWEEKLREGKPYRLRLPWDTEILWYPHFMGESEADALEEEVKEKVTMYHPTYYFQTPSGITQETVNRKGQARICDDFNFGIQYDNSRDKSQLYVSQKMEPWTRALLQRVEDASESVFNAIWFNHYRDGTVTIHWHTDGNEGLGPDPVIGSLSIGATRDFAFKSKREWHGQRGQDGAMHSGLIHLTLPLFHGSLCVMGRNSQRHWLHAVPAMEGVRAERFNLTFRFWALEGFETIDQKEAKEAEIDPPKHKRQYRLRVVPRCKRRLAPVILDSPSNASAPVSEMLQRLQNLLPAGIGGISLVSRRNGSREVLQNEQPLLSELERLGYLPSGEASPCFDLELETEAEPDESSGERGERAELSALAESGSGFAELIAEVARSPAGPYSPPTHLEVEVPDGGDWIWEVIQNLSGIQRKSKGKGRISQMVYHQTSEFVALYVARPKSSIHLALSFKRPLRYPDLTSGAVCGPLRRLQLYGRLLAAHLQVPAGCQVGLPLRKLAQPSQAAAQLLSWDLRAPDPTDLTRRHFRDFTGSDRFLSPGALAEMLATRSPLPASGKPDTEALACHRCGQLFGDSMRQLLLHLRRCDALPKEKEKQPAPVGDSAVALLEEMGFTCGREALQELLHHTEGSVERAVEFLSA